ncbi:LRR domain containing protein [Parasponia andersonii]|uniref:LRR domain containing protein n=1 Tax=Parasponia andersonii TaxID=3476 RepID=A0A2P5A6X1_PARAD|nr:LRR domain containing protein [Parasponia andersonii]
MNLSNNNFSGKIPNPSAKFTNCPEIDMSFNHFKGPVSHFLFEVAALHLFCNRFSKLNAIRDFNNDSPLSFLDISSNQLFVELPDCWMRFKELQVLLLANNELLGKIPISIGSLTQIKTLHLGNDNLSAQLPSSLKHSET